MNPYQDIEICELETTTLDSRFLLIYGTRHFEANRSVVELLKILQQCQDEASAIDKYSQMTANRYSSSQIKNFITSNLLPIIENKIEKKHQFLYHRELIKAKTIDSVSKALSILFTPCILIPVMIFALLVDLWFMFTAKDLLLLTGEMNLYVVVEILLFMCASSFFHEFGHAAACKRMGVMHGGIGFGMYLTFPVFYTDVSQIWRLPRKKRIVVNIAGIYFQCYILIGLLIWYYTFNNNGIARYFILMMNLGFILTLNPFFRFDGYWIASDALGIANLRQRSIEMLLFFWRKITHTHNATKPYLMHVKGIAKWLISIYVITVNIFMGFYFFYIIPHFLYRFIQSFPSEIEQLILFISNNIAPPMALIRNIFMQLLFLCLIIYMILGLSKPLWNKYVRNKQY